GGRHQRGQQRAGHGYGSASSGAPRTDPVRCSSPPLWALDRRDGAAARFARCAHLLLYPAPDPRRRPRSGRELRRDGPRPARRRPRDRGARGAARAPARKAPLARDRARRAGHRVRLRALLLDRDADRAGRTWCGRRRLAPGGDGGDGRGPRRRAPEAPVLDRLRGRCHCRPRLRDRPGCGRAAGRGRLAAGGGRDGRARVRRRWAVVTRARWLARDLLGARLFGAVPGRDRRRDAHARRSARRGRRQLVELPLPRRVQHVSRLLPLVPGASPGRGRPGRTDSARAAGVQPGLGGAPAGRAHLDRHGARLAAGDRLRRPHPLDPLHL
ncbi:MAG: Permease of the drug/metabolite transporter (DMT) superfamily, partial [uncultured Thermomicrobiales bacterium]